MTRAPDPAAPASPRQAGIESFRVLAAFLILYNHTKQYQGTAFSAFSPQYMLLDVFMRFAVPFFFLTAGYFFYTAFEKGEPLRALFLRYSRKLLVWYAFWTVVYALLPRDFVGGWMERGFGEGIVRASGYHLLRFGTKFREEPLYYLFESSMFHLWFLPALVMALGLVAFFVSARLERFLLPAAVVLYAVGLLGSSYQNTRFGIDFPFLFDGKDGPFMSTFFVALGWIIAKYRIRLSFRKAACLALAGYGLGVLENLAARGFSPEGRVLTLSCHALVLGPAMFWMALALPEMGRNSAARLGKLTPGIYLSQIAASDMTWRLHRYFAPPVWEFLFPAVIFAVAAAITVVFSKIPVLRKGVE
ncbi:MAG TPA: acyltransferase [Verrucomicrobiae bacterium]|nr:acyltransferase [Verrucomicrobiae bacterium]